MQEHRYLSPWHSCVADSSGENNSPLALIHRLDGCAPHSSGFGRLCSNQAEMILRVLLPSSIFQFLEGPRTIYCLPEKGRTVDMQRPRSMVIRQMAPDLISAFLFLLGFSIGAPLYNGALSFGLGGIYSHISGTLVRLISV
jgi:hypothetical protein